jgi:hypothetical protein
MWLWQSAGVAPIWPTGFASEIDLRPCLGDLMSIQCECVRHRRAVIASNMQTIHIVGHAVRLMSQLAQANLHQHGEEPRVTPTGRMRASVHPSQRERVRETQS